MSHFKCAVHTLTILQSGSAAFQRSLCIGNVIFQANLLCRTYHALNHDSRMRVAIGAEHSQELFSFSETVNVVDIFQAVLPNHEKTPMVVDGTDADAEVERDCKSEPRLAEHETNSLTSSASSSATSAEFARSSREEAARNYWDSVQLSTASYQQVVNSVPAVTDGVKVTECPSQQFVTVNVSNTREVGAMFLSVSLKFLC